MQSNDIIKLFNLIDDDLVIEKVKVIDKNKNIHIRKELKPYYCPECGKRMLSKDTYVRKVNHPLMQDGFNIILYVYQRRFVCKDCKETTYENFSFLEKGKHNSTITPLLIMDALRTITNTIEEVSERFNVSHTYVHQTFMKYVAAERLPLSEVISIDEVGLGIDNKANKYQLVVLDFITQQPIDVVKTRRKEVTEPYFRSIPLKERLAVKYLLCDMYNPYINYVNTC